jgi:hypothetical protein
VTYRASHLELDIRNDAGRGNRADRAGETGDSDRMDKVGSGQGYFKMTIRNYQSLYAVMK